jgi:CRISPR-associated protein Csh1
MIESLWQLGKMHLKYDLCRDESSLGWEDFVEEPFDVNGNPEREYRVIFIEFIKDGEQWKWDKVTKEDYKPEDKMKYLYRKGASNGADLSCTSILVEPDKTFRKKMIKWFANSIKGKPADNLLCQISRLLNENDEAIIGQIQSLCVKKENQLLTIRWTENNKYCYPGDVKEVVDSFKESSLEKFQFKHSCQSSSLEIPCSVCGKVEKSMGFGFPFSFYTIDNPGFVTGGFSQKRSVNNLPLCLQCILTLEKGIDALKGFHIKYAFGVSDCFVLPKLLKSGDNAADDWKKIVQLRNIFKDKIDPAKALNTIDKSEDRLFRYFDQQSNWVNLGFLFFKEKKANFEILMYAEDVLPSRLSRINSTMITAKNDIPESWKGDDSVFRFLKDIFDSKETGLLRKDYLEVLRRILMGQPISYDFILDRAMRKIRSDFSKEGNEYFSLVKTRIVYKFLNELGIIKH